MPLHSLKICWIHLIWATKERFDFFSSVNLREHCYNIIKEICQENNIYLKTIYINPEHIHLLIDLAAEFSLSKTVQLLKGISSKRLNEITKSKFEWQRGYGAFSVSAGNIDDVVQYINNQKEHHHKMSFSEEWEKYILHFNKVRVQEVVPEVAEATE
ncbi:MAG: IS200/IS605 family transposase [Candidatus Cloacimonetes bacterium]|nr:IS200/IS605 family transposase [Candidatus Cloacimonadota bacterium]